MTITIEDRDTGASYFVQISNDQVESISRNYADGAQCRVYGTASPAHESKNYQTTFECLESW